MMPGFIMVYWKKQLKETVGSDIDQVDEGNSLDLWSECPLWCILSTCGKISFFLVLRTDGVLLCVN